jgi:hypothetical protein
MVSAHTLLDIIRNSVPADATLSDSLSPNTAKTAAILRTLMNPPQSPDLRKTILLAHHTVKQFAVVVDKRIVLLTLPTMASDTSGNPLLLGGMGDTLSNLTPMSVPTDDFFSFVLTLVPANDAESNNLLVLTADPTLLADPSAAEDEDAPDPTRLQFAFTGAEDAPTFVALPLALPIPFGTKFPETIDLATVANLSELTEYELGRIWYKGVRYLFTTTNGSSLHEAAHLFTPSDLEIPTTWNLRLAPTVKMGAAPIAPWDAQYDQCRSILDAEVQAACLRLTSDTVLPSSPTLGPQSPVQLDLVAEAVAGAVSGLLEHRAHTEVLTSAEKEHQVDCREVIARYKLLGAYVSTSVDAAGGTPTISVIYPELTPAFSKCLKHTNREKARDALVEDLARYLDVIRRSLNVFLSDCTLTTEQVDAVFVGCLRRGAWATRPVTIDPESVKDKLGVIHLASIPISCTEYTTRVENLRALKLQEYVEEDKSKRATKVKELYRWGETDSPEALKHIFSNIFALLNFMFVDVELHPPALWTGMTKLYEILFQTADGDTWLRQHRSSPHLFHHLVIEMQILLNLFTVIPASVEYRDAVLAGRAIHPQVYLDAIEQSSILAAGVRAVAHTMSLDSKYSVIPPSVHLFGNQPARLTTPERKKKEPPTPELKSSTPKQEKQGRKPKPEADKSKIDMDKKKGMCTYLGPGKPPVPPIWCPNPQDPTGNPVRPCANWLYRGYACTFKTCRFAHINRVADVGDTANQAKFRTWVGETDNVAFAAAVPAPTNTEAASG